MKEETLIVLDSIFEARPIMRATSSPGEDELASASNRLGVKFPADYAEFLKRYGAAMVGPYPVFGLRPVDVMEDDRWSVVDVTESIRRSNHDVLSWVVISEDHAGNPIGFDDSGKIMIYDHDFGGVAKIADDFEEYIRSQCLKLSG